MDSPSHNLLILSDLHLSEGFRPIEGKLSPNEDFLSDQAFADLLRFQDELRPLGLPWRLIIAGDGFDFLQVTSLSAVDVNVLADRIRRLKSGSVAIVHGVADPQGRRAQAMEWLNTAIGLIPSHGAQSLQAVIDCAMELKSWAPAAGDGQVWDLERLALETWILASKSHARLTESDKEYGLGTSRPESMWKVDRMAEGHPVFFSALALFLDRGHSLFMMPGNHDIELYYPEVQGRLRDLIADAHADLRLADPPWSARPVKLSMDPSAFRTALQTQFEFCPWVYFEPGVLYLEHGNQYDVVNAFEDFLNPTLIDNDKLVRMPPGSFFVRYFFNKVEQSFPFADNLRPTSRFVAWAFEERFRQVLAMLFHYRAGLWRFASELIRVSRRDDARDRRLEQIRERGRRPGKPIGPEKAAGLIRVDLPHAEVLNGAARGPLTTNHLIAIEELALRVRSPLVRKILELGRMALPILLATGVVVGVILVFLMPILWELLKAAPQPLSIESYLIRLVVSVGVGFVLKLLVASGVRALAEGDDHLLRAASKIWQVLKEPNESGEAPLVRYLVFGHTHNPDMRRLGSEGTGPWYVNTGCWLNTVSEVDAWDRLERDFTFLQIIAGRETEIPGLYRWNQATERPERVRRRLGEDETTPDRGREA